MIIKHLYVSKIGPRSKFLVLLLSLHISFRAFHIYCRFSLIKVLSGPNSLLYFKLSLQFLLLGCLLGRLLLSL